LLLPVVAVAQGTILNADLNGDNVFPGPGSESGAGFASVTIAGTTVTYSIVVSGVDTITAAHIHEGAAGTSGGVVVNFNATFVNGAASGSVTADQSTLDAIVANPSGYYVNVHTSNFPDGAVRGQLRGPDTVGETALYFPIAAAVSGAAGTRFLTDARMINRSGEEIEVTMEFYPQGNAGNSAPDRTRTATIGPNEQAVVNDIVGDLFEYDNRNGAICMTADRPFTAFARIYNDRTDVTPSEGTLGQFVVALPASMAYSTGQIPFCSNEPSASGADFRTNIGWFNPSGMTLSVTFWAWDAETGALLASKSRTVNGWAQEQYNVGSNPLFGSSFSSIGDFYITYAVDGGYSLFVYASRGDNINGDAIYVPAAQ
jgi:hypothetical protein